MKKMMLFYVSAMLVSALTVFSTAEDAVKIKALILDGQNNHNWKATTPVLKSIYEKSERFVVDVATAPPSGQDMSIFKPDFSKYDLVVLNYNGDKWSQETCDAFEKFVAEGGGVVSYHAADNAFTDWKEYNLMTGLGGWGGRNEKSGPYVYVELGQGIRKIVYDNSPGDGGHHGPQVEFLVKTFSSEHPIMKGLPEAFLHVKDELYCKMRGPGENMSILGTADSKKEERGSGREEPLLIAITYKKGRIFHTMLGHDVPQCRCVGFQTTLLRGSEWAATAEVTIPCPEDYPTATQTSIRE
ncbi:MAG: ThuA domain-containing protein [Planctomycetaceae bacterium]|jgi:type 1 glutamine amidotransferase|nr:ThuA domain-containing protein [Planctomycetaceae bacterium]